MSARVLLTDAIHPVGAAMLERAGCTIVQGPDHAPETLYRLAIDADAVIVRSKLPDDLLDRAPRIRAVVRHGVGLDLIPLSRATALGIPVANAPSANAQAVAEYVFAALFEIYRRLGSIDQSLRQDGWAAARGRSSAARELNGTSLGIVGLGNIGGRVAQIGHHGFGMRVFGHQRRLDALPTFVTPASLPKLFSSCDTVVLCCPLTRETHHLVGRSLIEGMKENACLINVARGEIVEEEVLLTALRERWIAAAALDVFAPQPLPPEHPFMSLGNVVLTPHLASLTVESMERMSAVACEEVIRILRGDRPVNLVNPEVWEASVRRQALLPRPDGQPASRAGSSPRPNVATGPGLSLADVE